MKYPRCKVGLRFWCNDWGERSRFNINWKRGLKEFLIYRGLPFAPSAMCCTVSKKRPLVKYQLENHCDLYITGERKAEGGARAGGHKSCFERSAEYGMNHFMPLWFWSNDDKMEYNRLYKIINSDCYTVYGLDRTGCVGCPFGKYLWRELEIMKQYEFGCYKLCQRVFGESYALRREYESFIVGGDNYVHN